MEMITYRKYILYRVELHMIQMWRSRFYCLGYCLIRSLIRSHKTVLVGLARAQFLGNVSITQIYHDMMKHKIKRTLFALCSVYFTLFE